MTSTVVESKLWDLWPYCEMAMHHAQQRQYLLKRENFTSTVNNNILDPSVVFKLLVTAVCHKPSLWKLLAPQWCSFWLQGNDQVPREHIRGNSCLKSQKRGVSSRKGGDITAAWTPPARETVVTPAAHAVVVVLARLISVRLISTWRWGERQSCCYCNFGTSSPSPPSMRKISLSNGLKFEIQAVYILRSSFASMDKETSKGNLKKWGNPCFCLSCCQTRELLGSSTPYGWDSNDPGDLLVIVQKEASLMVFKACYFRWHRLSEKTVRGGSNFPFMAFSSMPAVTFYQTKGLGPHGAVSVWDLSSSHQVLHSIRHPDTPVSKPE